MVGHPPLFRRKLYIDEIHSTVEKRTKRMPDSTVETILLSVTTFTRTCETAHDHRPPCRPGVMGRLADSKVLVNLVTPVFFNSSKLTVILSKLGEGGNQDSQVLGALNLSKK